MCPTLHPFLDRFLESHPDLRASAGGPPGGDPGALIGFYEHLLADVEERMWRAEPVAFESWLDSFQGLHRELQALIDASGARRQHHFLLAVTVADRPAHVRTCLESILAQCDAYGYGGRDTSGRYAKVKVVLAEDSREPANVLAHRGLAAEFSARGLSVLHFDLPEQFALLDALPGAQRARLARLLTDQPADRLWHKGQAANRNLAYLKLMQLGDDPANTLYYFVDSDQAFEVNVVLPGGERALPALNYFFAIDRIFRRNDIRMLTGKLVGDPPVSPAVMAANFLDDVAAFLGEIGGLDPEAVCSFHGRASPLPGDAAYHDHAHLFGLGAAAAHFDYRCPLTGPHDHAACLDGFTRRLRDFFFGEHLTRRTRFEFTGATDTLTPARTVYPGNYVVDHSGLKYIIPFGHLRLRMSGPTAGRLIQAEIGARFASANLPMLHRRTTLKKMKGRPESSCSSRGSGWAQFRPGGDQNESGDTADEFRPGVTAEAAAIDIGDEFERQFFGDLMLFSVVEWLKEHDLDTLATHAALPDTVAQVEADLLRRYAGKREAIAARHSEIGRWLTGARRTALDPQALDRIAHFLDAIAANFGDGAVAWRQIHSDTHRARRRAQIVDALRHYRVEREAWDALFS